MSGARVFVFVNGDAIRLQLEPAQGGVISADLDAKEAYWLGSALIARTDGNTVHEPKEAA
ncbi:MULTISPECIES: hypothetical protein [Nocardia]|uniref:hypothetical protein n=1 Tax=Nocardia TaxID=1817 RepID=UPI000D69320C|nr:MULTISPECIES: hypothetical protein [Nocardia]